MARFLASAVGRRSPGRGHATGIFGYCLTADTSQQKAFAVIGPKRSGKGTIGRILVAMLGAHNCAAPTLAKLGRTFGLESLIGKRLAVISDARLSSRADQHAIAERIFRSPVKLRPTSTANTSRRGRDNCRRAF